MKFIHLHPRKRIYRLRNGDNFVSALKCFNNGNATTIKKAKWTRVYIAWDVPWDKQWLAYYHRDMYCPPGCVGGEHALDVSTQTMGSTNMFCKSTGYDVHGHCSSYIFVIGYKCRKNVNNRATLFVKIISNKGKFTKDMFLNIYM